MTQAGGSREAWALWPGGAAWIGGEYCPVGTRGRLAAGSRDLRTARCTFYCYAVPFVWIATPGQQGTGVRLWISEVTRIPPRSVDPLVKNYHWLDMEVAQLEAHDHGAQLVVLRDESGAITEGPGFNVFAHVDGRWLTPASGTLAGITRRSLIELAAETGDTVQEGRLSAGDLRRAAEVAITSTAGGIMPVTLLDGQPVGTGTPGPRTTSLRERYWARHEDPRFSAPVRYDSHELPAQPQHQIPGITLSDEDKRAPIRRYLQPEFGCPCCSRCGCFVCFLLRGTRYLNSVSAAGPVQISLLLLFLELSGYYVNAVQLHVHAADVLVRCGIYREGFR